MLLYYNITAFAYEKTPTDILFTPNILPISAIWCHCMVLVEAENSNHV